MGSLAELGYRNVQGIFDESLEEALGEIWAKDVGLELDSDQPVETLKWLGNIPKVREWAGPRGIKSLAAFGQTVENKWYENTVAVAVDDLRNDKTGKMGARAQIKMRMGEFATTFAELWNDLLVTLITNGTGSTSGYCFDGQYYFDSDHASGSSGTQTNLVTSTQASGLNITNVSPAAPTTDEMAKAVLQVIGYMMGWKDDQGRVVNKNVSEFFVLCSTNTIWAPLVEAVNLQTIAAGAESLLNKLPMKIHPVLVPELQDGTNNTMWILGKSARRFPFVLQTEQPVQLETLGEQSDHCFKNNEVVFGGKFKGAAAYGDWKLAAHCTFS